MSKLLENITKFSLSIVTAIAVLTLNLTAFVHCSSLNMSDECCHVTQTVKKCCAKNINAAATQRISSHCGCSMKQAPAAADLFIELKNSTRENDPNKLQYGSIAGVLFSSASIHKITAEHSPPKNYQSDIYLTVLSIRI